MSKVTNITFAGIGGQGVLKGTDILAEVAFEAGFDVKKKRSARYESTRRFSQ